MPQQRRGGVFLRRHSADPLVCDDLSAEGARERFGLGRGFEFQTENRRAKNQGQSENARLDALAIKPSPDLRHWFG
jgi:hypothetical protein